MGATLIAAGVFLIAHLTSTSASPQPSDIAWEGSAASAEPSATLAPSTTPPAPEYTGAPEMADGELNIPADAASAPNVIAIEERLLELGYHTEAPTGELTDSVKASLLLFQQRNALPPTGAADQATIAALFAEPENYLAGAGMSGGDIALLQARLKRLGYACETNGLFDNATSSAVKSFQNANHLVESGVVDYFTYRVLFSPQAKDPTGKECAHYFISSQPESDIKAGFISTAEGLQGRMRSLYGRGPSSFCSTGLVYFALRQNGVQIPYMDANDWATSNFTTVTGMADLQAGDIIVFSSHVGICLGNDKMVHASSITGDVTITEDISSHPYYSREFVAGKRIFE